MGAVEMTKHQSLLFCVLSVLSVSLALPSSFVNNTTTCLEKNCKRWYDDCLKDADCSGVAKCIGRTCPSTACVEACVTGHERNPEVLGLGSCGGNHGCWSPADTQRLLGMYKALHSVDGNHCYQLAVTRDTGCFEDFWANHGQQYDKFSYGLCPSEFSVVLDKTEVCSDGSVVTEYLGIGASVGSEAPHKAPVALMEPQQCQPLNSGYCKGSAVNTTGSCCPGAFCKYWQSGAGAICQGCYNCKCISGGPGATDDPKKCIDSDGHICPSVQEC